MNPVPPLSLAEREEAIAGEIQRLREYAAGGCRNFFPSAIDWRWIDLDDGMLSLVSASGNAGPEINAFARVQWHWERRIKGDLEVGPRFPVIDALEVWAAIGKPGLPAQDITHLCGDGILGELTGLAEAQITAYYETMEAA